MVKYVDINIYDGNFKTKYLKLFPIIFGKITEVEISRTSKETTIYVTIILISSTLHEDYLPRWLWIVVLSLLNIIFGL